MISEGTRTRKVEELASSLIANVIKIGTHIAIVSASMTSNMAQTAEVNIGLNIEASTEPETATLTVGKATRIIKTLIRLINKNGVKAHNSI